MAKCIDITDKLSFDKNPVIIIRGKRFTVNAEASTVLEIMGTIKNGKSEAETTLEAYEKMFSERDRKEISKMHLPFKDLKVIIETAMDLIQEDEPQGEQ